jgi:hypothetical protein
MVNIGLPGWFTATSLRTTVKPRDSRGIPGLFVAMFSVVTQFEVSSVGGYNCPMEFLGTTGPIPAAPDDVTAQPVDGGSAVQLKWNAPASVDVAAYAVYRDGALRATTPAGVTRYTDSEMIVPGQHTRYHVSLYSAAGAESHARAAMP